MVEGEAYQTLPAHRSDRRPDLGSRLVRSFFLVIHLFLPYIIPYHIYAIHAVYALRIDPFYIPIITFTVHFRPRSRSRSEVRARATSPTSLLFFPPFPFPSPPRPLPGVETGFKVNGWTVISTLCVSCIFFLQGLCLKTDELRKSFESWKAIVLAVFTILGLTALYGLLLVTIPFTPTEFRLGAALFSCVPTTLTSGVTLVGQANGNGTLALLLTAGTNVLGTFISPFWFKAFTQLASTNADTPFEPLPLLVNLLITVLATLVVGKLVRECHPSVKVFVNQHKVPITLLTNFFLIVTVWITISKSQSQFLQTAFGDIMIILTTMVILHVVWLAQSHFLARMLRLPWKDYRCNVILMSQKTLPVSITIISLLPAEVGSKGLLSIPCIVGHLSQLMIDTFVVTRWIAADEARAEEEAALAKKGGIGGSSGDVSLDTLPVVEEENGEGSVEEAGEGGSRSDAHV